MTDFFNSLTTSLTPLSRGRGTISDSTRSLSSTTTSRRPSLSYTRRLISLSLCVIFRAADFVQEADPFVVYLLQNRFNLIYTLKGSDPDLKPIVLGQSVCLSALV
jgi:hypothetical protein